MKTIDQYGQDVTSQVEIRIYDPEGNEVQAGDTVHPGWYCIEIDNGMIDEVYVDNECIAQDSTLLDGNGGGGGSIKIEKGK